MANDVSLGSMVKDRIASAIGLECAIAASWQPFCHCLVNHGEHRTLLKKPRISIFDMSQPECFVAHLRKHPAFIAGVNIAIIVVDDHANADARRGSQVHITCSERCQNPLEQKLRVSLTDWCARLVELDNVGESALKELDECFRLVTDASRCFCREPVGTDVTQENGAKSLAHILVDNRLRLLQAFRRGVHKCRHSIISKPLTNPANAFNSLGVTVTT